MLNLNIFKKKIGLLTDEKKEPEIKTAFSIKPITEVVYLPDVQDKTGLDVTYPLISTYAYAHIFWDKENHELVYYLEEPKLDEQEKSILTLIEEGLRELINISFINIKDQQIVIEYLEKNVRILLNELHITISDDTFLKFMYYIYRDFVGLNEIEPLMQDYFIEDIECNGSKTPIFIVHRKYRNLRTNIVYPNNGVLASFVEKLAQKAGKYVSYSNPLLDGRLPDGSRINATYTTDVSSRGPTFTVRRFSREPWTPVKLIDFRTVSPEILAYLWMAIEYESNIMVVGGTGTGKTSFLNAISFFIPPASRVVSIEDTKELNLMRENWLPTVAREGTGLANIVGQKHGEVSLFDLLKESFRQRPDYVIVGEIRGKEAYVLFQGMSSLRGNEEIFVLNKNKPLRIKIKELENLDIKNLSAITYDINNRKCKILPIGAFVRHPKRSKLFKIITRLGREVTITPDHSLFSLKEDKIIDIRTDELKIGSKLVIPSSIPCGYNNLNYIDLLEYLPDIRVYAPEYIKEASNRRGYYVTSALCNCATITDYYSNFKRSKPSAIKSEKFLALMKEAGIKYDIDRIMVRFDKKSKSSNVLLPITDYFLKFLGYYLSGGSLDQSKGNNRICVYNKRKEVLDDMRKCIYEVTGIKPKERMTVGFGTAIELSFSHKIIFELIKRYCNSKLEKKIPDFIFGLDKRRIGIFLSALYCGDGSLSQKLFCYYTASKNLANDVAQLLLVYGIVAKIDKRNRFGRKTTDYEVRFYHSYKKQEFLKFIRPIGKEINVKVFDKPDLNLMGDLYCDEVKAIEALELNEPEYVYDLCIPCTQNFIGGFGTILLHNSGHPSFGTMHAEDVNTMVRRLETEPINLSPSLVESLDIVCVMVQTKVGSADVRRIREIVEIISVKEQLGKIETNTPFVRDPATDKFFFRTNSYVFDKISKRQGVNKNVLLREFKLRSNLLFQLYKNKIFGFKEVQEIINDYYKTPEAVLKRFSII
ncbi:Flp pilus assembly complex ATPase component TadA [Candidatus Woesearchaeota archaeon]|nr:Flp pilus assembly complex ATPase component TadA [Candidatus Woesearchaeota archaeon]